MGTALMWMILNLFCIWKSSFGNALPSGFYRDSSHTCPYGEKAKLPNHECVKIIMVHDRINTENSSSLSAVTVQIGEESLTYLMSDLRSPIKANTRVTAWMQDTIVPATPISHVTDCVIVGHLENNDYDRIHISLCDKLIGWFEYGNWSYTIHNGPVLTALDKTAAHMEILVSKTERQLTAREVDGRKDRAHIRARRETTQNLTIETVLILDELYITRMAKAGYTSNAQLTNLMQLKWSGVQAEWGKANVLGYKVVLEIKEIVFWRKNPAWYSPSKTLGDTLISVCSGTNSNNLYMEYDHIHLYTGITGTDVAGKAYQGKICSDVYKCAVSTDTGVTEYVTSAHELGHCMNMYHDGDVGCPHPNDGIMGSKTAGWSTCSVNSMKTLLRNTAQSGCLTTTNVASPLVMELSEIWPGMIYTDDEICEFKHGLGYRFRKFPLENMGSCYLHSCINMNVSSTDYGIMFNYLTPTDGSYCGPEMVCSTQLVDGVPRCIHWNNTGLDFSLFEVVPGGWSDWGPNTTCSRTCGTGISYRRRTCSNPKPKNSAWCAGNEYESFVCNTQPCDNDPDVESELKIARASETCATLKANNIYEKLGLNASVFLDSGEQFNRYDYGQCEVKCNSLNPVYYYQRFGLMPDGTPCDPADLDSFIETNKLARRSGRYGRCVQGYCQMFGCDNVSGTKANDECGVCGGNNSTCNVVKGVFNESVAFDTRQVIATLPSGSFNIVFYFNYNAMTYNFIELYSMENRGVMTLSYVRLTNPFNYAGSYWYGNFRTQFLYTEGPISRPVVIKFVQKGSSPNVGVYYAYSLSLDNCTGSCGSYGTWNQTLCGCQCNSGYFGASCNTTCNKICNNGMSLMSTGCGCNCLGNTYGTACECRYPFQGKDCQDCKVKTCKNGGTFNSTACRCSCPQGFGDLDCGSSCQDKTNTTICVTNVGKGWCGSRNEQMERDCYMSCGLCVCKYHNSVYPVSKYHNSIYPVSKFHNSVYPVSKYHNSVYPVSKYHNNVFPVATYHNSFYQVATYHNSVYPVATYHNCVYTAST
ncbi:A disintegrin and metalloproteinase with thrombospondin motifs 18-like [Dreissena polymorpha]|uniref:A disintegrin and metalloproteinase with thrombospondin motifs 18-like n=1 Tax=Dreissena polymorpha TaxID=45954 RepID=UPI002264FB9A|nr:A disintegrin and metalloproteinase with thrombospondin motifs 18-like [Dreissena polymorpha]